MQTIPIQAIPAQTFTYADPVNNEWNVTIKLVGQSIAFSFTRNGVDLIDNITAVAGVRIIPYDYLEDGNFVLITQNQQVPDYTQFGITQTLVFLEASDIAALRQPLTSLAKITAANFDPNGGLPLRFAPQGYKLAT